jgi:pimeloyl-ACP methyl ester carboxylesterase
LQDPVNDPLTYKSNHSENYKSLLIPVVLIWGDKDSITPINDTAIRLKTIPNVSLHTLTGTGHIPMVENHDQFDRALYEALIK